MAIENLRQDATQLVEWGKKPALATRVSIPNVNLLSAKGSILYGTGNPATSEASIDGNTYQYAEVKALSGVGENGASIGKSVLFNDGDGKLSWANVVDNLTTNDGSKVLSAQVGYDIDNRLQLTSSKVSGVGAIVLGSGAVGTTESIAVGSGASAGCEAGIAIGFGAATSGQAAAIAIGSQAKAMATTAIQLGGGTNNTARSFQVFNTPMLVDGKIPLSSLSPTITVNEQTGLVLSNKQSDNTMSYDGTVVLGPQAVAKGQDGIAIGAQAVASGNGIAIGGDAVYASSGGIAVGVKAEAGTDGIAIGDLAVANSKTIQLGYNGDVDNNGVFKDNETGKYLLQIGRYSLMGNDGCINKDRIKYTYKYLHQVTVKATISKYRKDYAGYVVFEILSTTDTSITNLGQLWVQIGGKAKTFPFYYPCNGWATTSEIDTSTSPYSIIATIAKLNEANEGIYICWVGMVNSLISLNDASGVSVSDYIEKIIVE